MLDSLKDTKLIRLTEGAESNAYTPPHLEEEVDDVINTGSKQFMQHQNRYEFVRDRVYLSEKP